MLGIYEEGMTVNGVDLTELCPGLDQNGVKTLKSLIRQKCEFDEKLERIWLFQNLERDFEEQWNLNVEGFYDQIVRHQMSEEDFLKETSEEERIKAEAEMRSAIALNKKFESNNEKYIFHCLFQKAMKKFIKRLSSWKNEIPEDWYFNHKLIDLTCEMIETAI